jgi:phosphate starvation-inducible PhoH-like protein
VDLPSGTQSGLRQVQDILEGVGDVYFSRLTSHDVVRHKLVADIVDAYERYDANQEPRDAQRISGSRPRRAGGSRDR